MKATADREKREKYEIIEDNLKYLEKKMLEDGAYDEIYNVNCFDFKNDYLCLKQEIKSEIVNLLERVNEEKTALEQIDEKKSRDLNTLEQSLLHLLAEEKNVHFLVSINKQLNLKRKA